MYKRLLDLPNILKKKSFFLLGPRATGKTTLIGEQLPDALVIDLLSNDTYMALLRRPSLIQEYITDKTQIVVIDEIQKLPELLDEVHSLIQKRSIRFLLTGSSARKLKHGGANLLAGRAWEARLFPLVSQEIDDFNLLKYLNHGGLPDIYQSEYPDEELRNYVSLYLKEEIKAEAVTRNVAAFAEFLDTIALANGCEINYERFSSDLQVSPTTLKNYLQILDDTLIGFSLRGFTKTRKRKATARAKHYLFDVGITRYLSRTSEILPKSKAFGDAFEHFIILEVRAYLSYARKDVQMYYWRSTSQFEVDLICGDKVAIEIKGSDQITPGDLKGLRAFAEEGQVKKLIAVSLDRVERMTEDGILILPWKDFLKKLWHGEIL